MKGKQRSLKLLSSSSQIMKDVERHISITLFKQFTTCDDLQIADQLGHKIEKKKTALQHILESRP